MTVYLCICMHFCLTLPSPQMFTPSCEGFFTSLGLGNPLSGHRDLGGGWKCWKIPEDITISRKFWFMNWSPGFSPPSLFRNPSDLELSELTVLALRRQDGSNSKPNGGEVQMNLFLLACQSSAPPARNPVLSRPGCSVFPWPGGCGRPH